MSAQPKRNSARPKRAAAPSIVPPIALRTTPVLLSRQVVQLAGTLTVFALTGVPDTSWTIVSLSARVYATDDNTVTLTVTQSGDVVAWTFRGSCNITLLPYVGSTFIATAAVQINVTARLDGF